MRARGTFAPVTEREARIASGSALAFFHTDPECLRTTLRPLVARTLAQ